MFAFSNINFVRRFQILIFHVENHPDYPQFEQCIMLHAFTFRYQELAFLFSSMFMMYLLPLAVIIFCYISIVIEIFKRSRNTNLGKESNSHFSLEFSTFISLSRVQGSTISGIRRPVTWRECLIIVPEEFKFREDVHDSFRRVFIYNKH